MVGDPTASIKYIVKVQPAGGEPFRVETKAKVELISPPAVGDVLRALYDPCCTAARRLARASSRMR
jgi:hypothetical protein